MPIYNSVYKPKIKVVLLLVWQLQHGFTKNATKVSPNFTVAQIHTSLT